MGARQAHLTATLCTLFLLGCERDEVSPNHCEAADECGALALDSWPGLPAGHIRYERGVGYRFNGIQGERIYRRPDSTVEGGFRFYDDQSDDEILMTVPESLNMNNTVSGQYDFRLAHSTLSATAYQLFSPAEILATSSPLPALLGESAVSYQVAAGGWGAPDAPVPFEAATELGAGDALDMDDSVWASTSKNNDLPYLLLRQAIFVGEGGVLRPGDPIALEGSADRDVSIFLRTASDLLVPLYQGEPTTQDLLRASLVPYDVLEPGINYLEIYASTGVASTVDRPPFQDDLESLTIGDSVAAIEAAGYTVQSGAWIISSFDAASQAVLDPGAPAQNGKILYQSENQSSAIVLPDPGNAGFPDVTLDLTFGVPALDDDLVTIWARHHLQSVAPGDQTGYFFFLRGPGGTGPAELSTAQVGLAMRSADGTITLLASNLDGPPLSTWVAAHGLRNNTAEHWRFHLETIADHITVDLSERGTRAAPAPAPSVRVIDLVDSSFESGSLAVGTDSQSAWFDDIDIAAVGLRAGLRIDSGETSATGIQSLDEMTTLPRYYVEGNTLYDRMGDGTQAGNANPVMTSGPDENWIDYLPDAPLALGKVEDLSCKCPEPP
jgi:hypothetical protein